VGRCRGIDEYFKHKYGVSALNNKDTFLFNLAYDGESLYDRAAWTTGVITYYPLDIPPSARGKLGNTRLIQLIAGPQEPKFMDGHMELLRRELVQISVHGVQTGDGVLRRGVLVGVDTDTPARQKMFNLPSHMSIPWCWRCSFLGVSVCAPGKTTSVVRWMGYSKAQPQVLTHDRLEQNAKRATARKKAAAANKAAAVEGAPVLANTTAAAAAPAGMYIYTPDATVYLLLITSNK